MPSFDKHSAAQIPERVEEIDWDLWRPVDQGTLLFVQRRDEILLIEKKRGLGAGYLNGPGGRLEPGESPQVGAIREAREELCIEAKDPVLMGELKFQFRDGYSIHVWVFLAEDFSGEPTETAEAAPVWAPVNRIPYDSMWEDDRHWLPLLLERKPFRGRFLFDRKQMLDYDLIVDGGNLPVSKQSSGAAESKPESST